MHDAPSLFLLGLVYGATVCSVSCLPYFGPYLMGTGNGFVDGVVSSLVFILGKVVSYAALGGVAASLGKAFVINDSHSMLISLALLGSAFTLPFVTRDGCRKDCRVIGKRASLFVLGIASSLMPCPPLAAVFLLAAKEGTLLGGVAKGFFYGLGLVISPMLIAGGGFALVSQKVRKRAKWFAPYMQGLAMLIMLVMAVRIMV